MRDDTEVTLKRNPKTEEMAAMYNDYSTKLSAAQYILSCISIASSQEGHSPLLGCRVSGHVKHLALICRKIEQHIKICCAGLAELANTPATINFW